MKQIVLRTASIVLVVALLTALTPLSAFAAAGGKATKVVVEAVSATGTVGRELTGARQIQRLLDLLPTKSQLSNPTTVMHGELGAKVTVYQGASAKETWRFYSDGCAIDGAGQWYTSTPELYSLLFVLAGNSPDAYERGTTFRGETVTGFYTFDGVNHSYNVAYESDDMIAWLEKVPETKSLTGKSGFLLFTDKGRYAWYYAGTSGNELLDFAAQNNSVDQGRRPQWLVYMNPDKIQSVTYSGMGGKNYTLGNAGKGYAVTLETTDRDSINQIAGYLKNMQVKPGAKRYNEAINFNMSAGLYYMRIQFSNGIEHIVAGGLGNLYVVDTDTQRTMLYETTENQIMALRDFMSLLPEAKLTDSK